MKNRETFQNHVVNVGPLPVKCVSWERGGMFHAADAASKLGKKNGYRASGSTVEQAVDDLRTQMCATVISRLKANPSFTTGITTGTVQVHVSN